jgi:hypothetical protein
MAMGWAAVIGFATLDPSAAKKTEQNFRTRETREVKQIDEIRDREQNKVSLSSPESTR